MSAVSRGQLVAGWHFYSLIHPSVNFAFPSFTPLPCFVILKTFLGMLLIFGRHLSTISSFLHFLFSLFPKWTHEPFPNDERLSSIIDLFLDWKTFLYCRSCGLDSIFHNSQSHGLQEDQGDQTQSSKNKNIHIVWI